MAGCEGCGTRLAIDFAKPYPKWLVADPGAQEEGLRQQNNSLEPTLLAAEKHLRVLPLSSAKTDELSPEPSGGSLA